MCSKHIALVVSLAAALASTAGTAAAHGMAGKRFFPATLATDDPFVADELSLPTVQVVRRKKGADSPPTWDTEIDAELSKRLSRRFGISLAGSLAIEDPKGGPTIAGFDNMHVAAKYVFIQDAARELLVSGGLEAVIPINGNALEGARQAQVGVIGQLHFYLDDILPEVFTWTPFSGVLGPTQPR